MNPPLPGRPKCVLWPQLKPGSQTWTGQAVGGLAQADLPGDAAGPLGRSGWVWWEQGHRLGLLSQLTYRSVS